MIYLEITDPTKLSLSMPMIVWFVWYLGTGLYLSGPLSPYKN
jgi:signal transduction histidine kinase